ncbi:MAG: Xaa-Pro dipeptidase [Peptococcaceae bacterium BRH_c4b]|nr:MAG: Xaa-Pro dipeptidase [Peptococcaceae bacterium BRH_c4b]
MNKRIDRLRRILAAGDVEAFLITRPENRFYLSGFTGSSGALLVSAGETRMFTDFRYEEQVSRQCPGCRITRINLPLFEALPENLAEQGIKVLGCEGDFLTYEQCVSLQESLSGIKIKPLSGLVERLREVKDEDEKVKIGEAVMLADRAFEYVLPLVKPGVPETSISLELEFFMRKNGASGAAFETIVASGPRSAMPHGVASDKLLQPGDLVVMDFGAVLDGYHSDITRTVVMGKPTGKQIEIYRIVLEAQQAALAAVRAGVTAAGVDRAARDVIASYGYGDNFGHSTGHGVGLMIHENPRLSGKSDAILEEGMVVTVEPGIYLPQWGGVRIEDTVLVEKDGCRIFTGAPKNELISCI